MPAKVIQYVVHFRESPDSPQWEESYFSKAAADGHALRVNLNGGIAIIVENLVDDVFSKPSEGTDDDSQ
jgi:predicted TIM-barrel enzyme